MQLEPSCGAVWAVHFVLSIHVLTVPQVVTDCKGMLDRFQREPSSLTAHDKVLARTWAMVRQELDDDLNAISRQIVWMPAHTSGLSLQNVADSTGCRITPIMWRANRLVDALAKAAAGRSRTPSWAPTQVQVAGTMVRHAAAQLGTVTYRANHHPVIVQLEGGAAITRLCRDSTAERPQPPRRRTKQTQKQTQPGADHQDPSASQPAECQAASAVSQARCRGRKRLQQINPQSLSSRGAKIKRRRLLLDALSEQEPIARWIAARDLAGASAGERMQRIRDKVRQRAVTEVLTGTSEA